MKKVKAAFRGIVIFLLCVIEIYPLFMDAYCILQETG